MSGCFAGQKKLLCRDGGGGGLSAELGLVFRVRLKVYSLRLDDGGKDEPLRLRPRWCGLNGDE